jgi:hypothetical protein
MAIMGTMLGRSADLKEVLDHAAARGYAEPDRRGDLLIFKAPDGANLMIDCDPSPECLQLVLS